MLDWYVENAIIKGSYNKEDFRKAAKLGGETNKTETQNMLIRAFRLVTGSMGATASNITKAISNSEFTFSSDSTEDLELRNYWYPRIESNKEPVDGEMLRVLMIRIYDYMNGGISE